MERTIFEIVGGNIAEQRNAKKMTQTDLALRTSLSRGSVGNIEAGRQSITLATLVLFSCALEVEPSVLLRGVTGSVEQFIDKATLDIIRKNDPNTAQLIINNIIKANLKRQRK